VLPEVEEVLSDVLDEVELVELDWEVDELVLIL
jgi:hypothetical protein